MNKNLTVFQDGFDSVTFTKDIGLIPITFKKHLGYNCEFLCYKINGPYDKLTEAGIHVTFIESEETIAAVLKKTDILILYGIYDYNLDMIVKYKAVKPDGKIYLKLDMNIHWLRRIQMNDNLVNLLHQCTLISVECRSLHKYIKEHWPVRVEYIPNGYYNFGDINMIKYEEKENIIITVSRLGSYEKATEILLEAFKAASNKISDWKIKLIGSIEESFKSYIEDYFNNNPELRDRVIFTGKITDRIKLEEEYKRAKVFCLTSRFEGFPNVFPESAAKGCYIISSDIDPAYDITNNKKYGSIFPIDNVEELAKELVNVCSDENRIIQVSDNIQIYAERNFNWEILCKRTEYYINMPVLICELYPHFIERAIMENPKSILDICKFPLIHSLLAEEYFCDTKDNIIIDRMESNSCSALSSYKSFYGNIYTYNYENILSTLDSMRNYDVIILSDVLENVSKAQGFMMVNKLLKHVNKKLVIAVKKMSHKIDTSRWSFIDFYKYDFSGVTIRANNEDIFIFSFYPNNNKENELDAAYKSFKDESQFKPEYSKKLNIAYILPHKSVTGGLKVLIKQMKMLKERGHSITGILQGNYTESIFPDTNKIEIDKEIILSWNDKIDDYLNDYDVIVTGFINDWMRIENENLPVILFEQGYETLFGEYNGYDYYREKNSKLYFDNINKMKQSLVMTVSPILSEILYYRYGRIADIIPNGIDTDIYYPENKNESDIIKILLIGSSYLGFKGFNVAFEVLMRLIKLNYNIEISWICQERPYYSIPLNVNYIINPEEKLLTETIRKNDILLSTSWYESFALPPLEAMASGVAVVATDNGGIRTYAENGYNCLLVEPGDTNALLSSLLSIILNKNMRSKLVSNGLKTALEFNNERMIDMWENNLYKVSKFYKAYTSNHNESAE